AALQPRSARSRRAHRVRGECRARRRPAHPGHPQRRNDPGRNEGDGRRRGRPPQSAGLNRTHWPRPRGAAAKDTSKSQGNSDMATTLVGLVGWRGMVGSVLMERMQREGDFALIEPVFFSTSNAGGAAPSMAKNEKALKDAHDIAALSRCDIVITAQGGDYTSEVFPKLRARGWKGHWIDAASTLRMKDDAVIVLDPVNMPVIKQSLAKGGRNWIGGNCTVSCMLMGVGALYKAGLVEWMN